MTKDDILSEIDLRFESYHKGRVAEIGSFLKAVKIGTVLFVGIWITAFAYRYFVH
jgi:hypothetical protein